jgi:hypothetical protein
MAKPFRGLAPFRGGNTLWLDPGPVGQILDAGFFPDPDANLILGTSEGSIALTGSSAATVWHPAP